MDHLAPSPELVRPWRTATIVATAVAGIELVLLVVAGVVLLGRSVGPRVHEAAAHHARPSAPASAAAATARSKAPPARHARAVTVLPRGRTRVIVMNGNGIAGAAGEAASVVKARGYRVESVGNATRTNHARTLVEYRPGRRREAVRLRHDLSRGVVTPLDGLTPAQLHGAQLVLILGADR